MLCQELELQWFGRSKVESWRWLELKLALSSELLQVQWSNLQMAGDSGLEWARLSQMKAVQRSEPTSVRVLEVVRWSRVGLELFLETIL